MSRPEVEPGVLVYEANVSPVKLSKPTIDRQFPMHRGFMKIIVSHGIFFD